MGRCVWNDPIASLSGTSSRMPDVHLSNAYKSWREISTASAPDATSDFSDYHSAHTNLTSNADSFRNPRFSASFCYRDLDSAR